MKMSMSSRSETVQFYAVRLNSPLVGLIPLTHGFAGYLSIAASILNGFCACVATGSPSTVTRTVTFTSEVDTEATTSCAAYDLVFNGANGFYYDAAGATLQNEFEGEQSLTQNAKNTCLAYCGCESPDFNVISHMWRCANACLPSN
ncbi:hypothetical protein OEA41_006187 [Lepraria neglecta]|uniref:Uncharacterized protein n=1 Tax=Lepraria neglecta TaxID=209136 RepID=A0AAD9Z9V6_9LECA|nr:hypothetical protein OEA41_006187 [Lepraria neglecta]